MRNFEMLNNKRIGWTKKRETDKKKISHNIKQKIKQKRLYKL